MGTIGPGIEPVKGLNREKALNRALIKAPNRALKQELDKGPK